MELYIRCNSVRGPYAAPSGTDRLVSTDDGGALYANDTESFHPPGPRGRHRVRNSSGDRGPISRDPRGGFVPVVGDRRSPARRSSFDVSRRPDEDLGSGLWNGRFAICQQDSGISVLDSPPMERHPERLMRGGYRGGGGHLEMCDKYSGGGRHSKGSSQRGAVVAPHDGGHLVEANVHHLEPQTTSSAFHGGRPQMVDPVRTDSVNSDPSDCSGRPVKAHHHSRHHRHHKRHSSASSSDDASQTTPEGTSCDEVEMESESISEKGQSRGRRVQFIL